MLAFDSNSLAGRAFFASEEVSIVVDFAIVGWIWRHERHKIALADFPNVLRWYRAVMARDGVGRGFGVTLKRQA